MTRLDLTRAAEPHRVHLGPVDLSSVERTLLEGTWRGRMVNEHVSARVFAALVGQAMSAGIDPTVQAELAEMISDELRHARKCAGVLLSLGGAAEAELPELLPMPEHPECDRLEAFLRNVLSVSCLSETVAVALIQAERLAIEGAPAGQVLKEILGDEVRHARLGWRLLEGNKDELRAGLGERLAEYLTVAFVHLVEHELRNLAPVPPPSAKAESLGACDGVTSRQVFADTVLEVIIPGLEALSIPARGAWARAEVELWSRGIRLGYAVEAGRSGYPRAPGSTA
ncbi:MAG: ferritin-like domain-containing protein [Deltaproteobacteria bacterium]|nr:ferritin-like domain-containing protein [Deltaproteobacteria bacterium]